MANSQTGLSADERAAVKALAAERRAEAKRGSAAEKQAAATQEMLDTIAALPGDDQAIAMALHAVVGKSAPQLAARTWYGMPAYALDGKVVVFFKPKSKFKMRYSEVGFNEPAQLDDGVMWPTVFAVTKVTPAVKRSLTDLVTKAVGG